MKTMPAYTADKKEKTEKRSKALLKTANKLKDTNSKLKELSYYLLERLVNEHTMKLLESERKYRELYESIDEAFIATDWDLKIIHWNKAAERITNIASENAIGKKLYEILPEMLPLDVTQYFETLRKKQPIRFMINVQSRQTKKQSIFEVSAYPSEQGIICLIQDKTEEENNKRLQAIGQTAGMVGHDIRNPLQAIISDVYLLRSDIDKIVECTTKEGLKESLYGIEENVSYINKIVEDLQDYARPISPKRLQTNIDDIFKDVLYGKSIPSNISVNCLIEPDASTIIVDPTLLKRILANLVNNAVQAMPSGGRLDLYACIEKGFFIITVKDSGIGIPETIKPLIFNPLFTTKSKGQGFGLAVVKRLIESMGGTVNVDSHEGKGTKFILSLPIEKLLETTITGKLEPL